MLLKLTNHTRSMRSLLRAHNPKEINPKMASNIAYWSQEFRVTGDQLHEAIRRHGTNVERIRAALHTHKAP